MSTTLFAQKRLPLPVKIWEEKLQKRNSTDLAVQVITSLHNYSGWTLLKEQKLRSYNVWPGCSHRQWFWHWLIFDIPSNTTELAANAGNIKLNIAPKGAIQSITDYGIKGFGGPCPPKGHGFHQYIITVYALKSEKLGLNENTNPAIVGFNLWNNVLAKSSIVAYYKR